MYIELVRSYMQDNKYIRPQSPATEEEICDAENKLNVSFPNTLRTLLSEMNGDRYLFYSAEDIVKTNLSSRSAFVEFADLSCYLFIAGNGCGDYYCYRIDNGIVQPSPIYIWEHESFQAKVVAANLEEMIHLYYQDKIQQIPQLKHQSPLLSEMAARGLFSQKLLRNFKNLA